jgi:hypothetical protein
MVCTCVSLLTKVAHFRHSDFQFHPLNAPKRFKKIVEKGKFAVRLIGKQLYPMAVLNKKSANTVEETEVLALRQKETELLPLRGNCSAIFYLK